MDLFGPVVEGLKTGGPWFFLVAAFIVACAWLIRAVASGSFLPKSQVEARIQDYEARIRDMNERVKQEADRAVRAEQRLAVCEEGERKRAEEWKLAAETATAAASRYKELLYSTGIG